jgi:hypothetical protein
MNITAEEYRKIKPKKANKKEEESLQIRVAEYLRTKHPNVIFSSDFGAGCKLTMGQATKNKKMQCGLKMPDMFIAKPNDNYHGLFLELKKSDEGVYLKDGQLSKNAHIKEQNRCHVLLNELGYFACFACGYENAIGIIEMYLK